MPARAIRAGGRCNMAGGDIRRDGAPLRAPVPIMPDR
ncbi:hypothetical protein M218_30140 [Burkholderia pseudomallei MSHR338]|nr:hypothetical protein M218_30140 [Burkholderia pseudomallei MSHR338]